MTLPFRFGRAEELVFEATAGVVFAVAAMASLAAAVLMPVGVDMVVMGGVVMCCAQLLELGCGNFYRLNSRAVMGGFGEAGGVTLL